jgi:hypothetical protein
MKPWIFSACALLLMAGCGGVKPEPEEKEEQLDPYLPPMSTRINDVLYSKRSKDEVLAELAVIGLAPGKDFEDFKDESGIDDWFSSESDLLSTRYTSLTCGLSPVVDADGKITGFYRSRKRIGDQVHDEMRLTPE